MERKEGKVYVKSYCDPTFMKTVFLSVRQSSQLSDWYDPHPQQFLLYWIVRRIKAGGGLALAFIGFAIRG